MLKHHEITHVIIKTYYDVYNELGFGFLERVYQNAMYLALKDHGLEVKAQHRIPVYFRGVPTGLYFADFLIEQKVIVEIKSASCLLIEHELQLQHYLKATDLELGLLFNFGITPEFRRKIWSNNPK